MTRAFVRRSCAVLATILLLVAVGPAGAHSPNPVLGWPLFGQNQALRYRWQAGEVPPSRMQTAINASAADASATRGSRAPTLAFDSAGTSTVEYGLNVFCGVNGLACADAWQAPDKFRVAFREHGHRFDWGVLQWCQLQATISNGCFDVENIALDEFGHVFVLGHHVNFDDERDYGDSVVQTVSRARPDNHWNAHAFGRCDVATLQMKYDMTTWAAKYSTCLDLATTLSLASTATAIWSGTTVTFTANLQVVDLDAYGRLGGNPVASRTVTLQRRSPGATSWTTVATMPAGTTAGTYVQNQSPTATYEWRALFTKPADEGLRTDSSTPFTVTVSTCNGGICPQSAPVSGPADR